MTTEADTELSERSRGPEALDDRQGPSSSSLAVAPVLVFGIGNPSRGDDALGPEFIRLLEARCADLIAAGRLEVLTDFQLQVEHALDLKHRRAVYFVDASARAHAVEVRPVSPSQDATFTTHLLSPAALLHTYESIEQGPPPAAWTIAIPGAQFGLGAPMSNTAAQFLEQALRELERRIAC